MTYIFVTESFEANLEYVSKGHLGLYSPKNTVGGRCGVYNRDPYTDKWHHSKDRIHEQIHNKAQLLCMITGTYCVGRWYKSGFTGATNQSGCGINRWLVPGRCSCNFKCQEYIPIHIAILIVPTVPVKSTSDTNTRTSGMQLVYVTDWCQAISQ